MGPAVKVSRRRFRQRRGTAITEALLVMIPLLFFAGLAPFVAGLFLDMQEVRTEAHRDMFDKTHTILVVPDTAMTRSVQGWIDDQFPGGELTEASRVHRFAEVPSLPEEINNGFPNNTVEGWEFIERRGLAGSAQKVHLISYAMTIRSPWTRLGYPWVTSQDILFEPRLLQSWGASLQVEDFTAPGGIWSRMRLAEHIPGPGKKKKTTQAKADPANGKPQLKRQGGQRNLFDGIEQDPDPLSIFKDQGRQGGQRNLLQGMKKE